MMFKDSEGYKNAVDFFGSKYQLATVMKFKCFADYIFTYSVETETEHFSIDFIADDMLLDEMQVLDILNLHRVSYLHLHYRLLGELKVSEEVFNLARTAENN